MRELAQFTQLLNWRTGRATHGQIRTARESDQSTV